MKENIEINIKEVSYKKNTIKNELYTLKVLNKKIERKHYKWIIIYNTIKFENTFKLILIEKLLSIWNKEYNPSKEKEKYYI